MAITLDTETEVFSRNQPKLTINENLATVTTPIMTLM